MQPDVWRVDTRAGFQKATEDLRCAQIDMPAEPPATEDALYHSPQAAEKGLQGFLAWHDQPFSQTHDLGKQACALNSLADDVVELPKDAGVFRCPGDVDRAAVTDAAVVLHKVRAFVEALLARFPEMAD